MSLALHILYRVHLLLVRILGGVGSFTEVSLVSLNRDFSTSLCFRGEKSRMDADRLDLFGSSRGAAGCDGRSGVYFQKRFC